MNNDNIKIKDFYTIYEFAEIMQVHHNTIRRAIKNARIMAFRLGSSKKSTFRIPHSEIQRILLQDLRELSKALQNEYI